MYLEAVLQLFVDFKKACDSVRMEERRLRVFENRVLRKIFRSKRDEVIGEFRGLLNEDFSDLYLSPILFWQ
jgi:hypothetical protein